MDVLNGKVVVRYQIIILSSILHTIINDRENITKVYVLESEMILKDQLTFVLLQRLRFTDVDMFK